MADEEAALAAHYGKEPRMGNTPGDSPKKIKWAKPWNHSSLLNNGLTI